MCGLYNVQYIHTKRVNPVYSSMRLKLPLTYTVYLTSLTHKTESVTDGEDATVYVWVFFTYLVKTPDLYLCICSAPNALLEKFWRISLYVTDDAIAKLNVT